jgi:hypothetical protein
VLNGIIFVTGFEMGNGNRMILEQQFIDQNRTLK